VECGGHTYKKYAPLGEKIELLREGDQNIGWRDPHEEERKDYKYKEHKSYWGLLFTHLFLLLLTLFSWVTSAA